MRPKPSQGLEGPMVQSIFISSSGDLAHLRKQLHDDLQAWLHQHGFTHLLSLTFGKKIKKTDGCCPLASESNPSFQTQLMLKCHSRFAYSENVVAHHWKTILIPMWSGVLTVGEQRGMDPDCCIRGQTISTRKSRHFLAVSIR